VLNTNAFQVPFNFYTGHILKIYPYPGNGLNVDYDCFLVSQYSTMLVFILSESQPITVATMFDA
jgi:hypothetical protein